MKKGLPTYFEYKVNLELCGFDTYEKDDIVRQKYKEFCKDSKIKKLNFKKNTKRHNNKRFKNNIC